MDRASDEWIAVQLAARTGWPVMSSEWLKRVGQCFREVQERRAKDAPQYRTTMVDGVLIVAPKCWEGE